MRGAFARWARRTTLWLILYIGIYGALISAAEVFSGVEYEDMPPLPQALITAVWIVAAYWAAGQLAPEERHEDDR